MNTLLTPTLQTWEHKMPLYAKWHHNLFAHKLWPQSFVHTHTMALACIDRLMECSDINKLEFNYENKYSSWNLIFMKEGQYLIEKSLIPLTVCKKWLTSVELIWEQLMSLSSVEEMLKVLSNILWDSTPESLREDADMSLDGLKINMHTKNLTESAVLESILFSASIPFNKG